MNQRPPAPSSVSEPARKSLDETPPMVAPQHPEPGDTDGWIRWAEVQQAAAPDVPMPPMDRLSLTTFDIDGAPTYVIRPTHVPEGTGPIVIDIHGGGLINGGGDRAWKRAAGAALTRTGSTWVPDYRMPPLHPYPTPLDDCLAVYRRALAERTPDQILISGGSAGGNLAAAVALRAKDEGLPMPAALVLLTPELDLTESGDTFQTVYGIDHLPPLLPINQLYANGHDLAHPYLSPLFGDLAGLPPTFLQAGTRDLFLSNTVRMHRRLLAAGVEVELHIFEAMPHGGFGGGTPEDDDLAASLRAFEERHLGL